MRTDAHLYQIFRQMPELIFQLTGLPSPGPCEMRTATVKAISRTMDGLIVPADSAQPLRVMEIQMQGGNATFPYQRILIEQASLQMEHHPREVETLLIFGTLSHDPKSEPGCRVVKVVYLDEALRDLKRRDPDHLLLSIFRPLLEPDDAALEKSAAADYRRIRKAGLPGVNPELLASIFFDWLSQRFKTRSPKQIAAMIAELTPIEETAVGRELIGIGMERGMEEGRKRGKEEGIETGKEQLLARQIRAKFSRVPASVLKQITDLPVDSLDDLAVALLKMPDLAALKSWISRR